MFVCLNVCKLFKFLVNINWLRQRENCVAGLQGAEEASRKDVLAYQDERENATSSDSPVKAF